MLALRTISIGFLMTLFVSASSAHADHDASVDIWCNDVLGVLDRAASHAQNWAQSGDFNAAADRMRDGLVEASHVHPGFGKSPLTRRAILRGIELSQKISDASLSQPNRPRVVFRFLQQYYQHVQSIANFIDRPYYRPHWGWGYPYPSNPHCHPCSSYPDFEQRFIDYIRSQASLVLDVLATSHGGMVYPFGSAKAFLTGLELSTGHASSDLRESGYAPTYACVIGEIDSLNRTLRSYNSSGAGYPDDVYAVNSSYFAARDAVSKISYPGCRWSSPRW
jgi:hypothetical protein